MSKIKTIKLQEDIDIRNIVIPLVLYLETKKNYIVQIQETDNGYSLKCKSKGWWKSLIGASVKFCMLLEKKEGNIFVSYNKFNFIYKTIILILGFCFCFDQDVFTFGAFLIVTSLYGFWLYLWHKLLISFYIKKCIKKKGDILTVKMFYSFASFLKIIEMYETVQDCEDDLLLRKKQQIKIKSNHNNETSEKFNTIQEAMPESVIDSNLNENPSENRTNISPAAINSNSLNNNDKIKNNNFLKKIFWISVFIFLICLGFMAASFDKFKAYWGIFLGMLLLSGFLYVIIFYKKKHTNSEGLFLKLKKINNKKIIQIIIAILLIAIIGIIFIFAHPKINSTATEKEATENSVTDTLQENIKSTTKEIKNEYE